MSSQRLATDYSFGYVAHWASGDPAIVIATAEKVIQASKAIMDELAATQAQDNGQMVPREEEKSDQDGQSLGR